MGSKGKDASLTDEERGYIYRSFGYFGGPLVLETMIRGLSTMSKPVQNQDTAAWFESALRDSLKVQAAAASLLADNPSDALKMAKLALRKRDLGTVSEEQRDRNAAAEKSIATFLRDFNSRWSKRAEPNSASPPFETRIEPRDHLRPG